MYKLAIFDLDGTLLDTLSSITHSVNLLLQEIHLPLVVESQILPFIGKGTHNMLASLCRESRISLEGLLERYNQLYLANLFTRLSAYEGVKDILARLQAEGIKIAVVTNKYQRQALDLVEVEFGATPFDFIYGVTDENDKKPNPNITNKVLNLALVAPTEAVFIGDSHIDYQTAENAGIDFLFVDWGYTSSDQPWLVNQTIISTAKQLEQHILENH